LASCTNCTVLSVSCSMLCSNYTVLSVLFSLCCTLCTVLSVLYSVYCTLCTVLYTVYSLYYTVLYSNISSLTRYLNKEVNCTEPSLQLVFPDSTMDVFLDILLPLPSTFFEDFKGYFGIFRFLN
jgi:hypothetical protein